MRAFAITLAISAIALAPAAGKAQAAAPAQAGRATAGAPLAADPDQAAFRVALVTNLHSEGIGSLRAAIAVANSSPGRRLIVIDFAVRGVIRLTSQLPVLTGHAIVNGRSAPGYHAGGPPVVEIDCAGNRGLALARSARGSALLAIAVDNASGDGVSLRAGRVTLDNDYIGLNLAGRQFGNRGNGVYVAPVSFRNHIGLNPSGASGVTANVISGNGRSGIVLDGADHNRLEANRIGTSPDGSAAIPNGRNGLRIVRGSDANEIGGKEFTDSATGAVNDPTGDKGTVTPVFVVPPLGNQISGNRGAGVVISAGSARNTLNGNFIGTTADGDAAIGNGGAGIRVDHADRNTIAGCAFPTSPFVYYNVVSGNRGNGLRITDSNGVVVQGNFFGIGANNATTIGNGRNGILVEGTSRNTQVGGVIPLGNVSGGNRGNGVAVTGQVRGFVSFNTFGGLFAFQGPAPNGHDGILITATGGHNLIRTSVLSGNRGNGIEVGGNAWGVTVDPVILGMNTSGKTSLPNGRDGLRIDGNAHGTIVGGHRRSVIRQNTISDNAGHGVVITGSAHDNHVFRTFIGTEILGEVAAANGRGGVLIGGHAFGNVIGIANARRANIISGNNGNGVTLRRGTRGNRVLSNFIGINRTRESLPNEGVPVLNLGHRNLIAGNSLNL